MRDATRTRRALLDGAARALAAQGPGVTLEAVAAEAEVSKGGLLHHFKSKEALFVGLIDDWMEQFDAAVERSLDPSDTRPGRLARAFINASFDDMNVGPTTREYVSAMTVLLGYPEVVARAQANGRRLREALDADGLHHERITLIVRGTDGTTLAELYEGELLPAERDAARALLLGLTEETGPLLGRSGTAD